MALDGPAGSARGPAAGTPDRAAGGNEGNGYMTDRKIQKLYGKKIRHMCRRVLAVSVCSCLLCLTVFGREGSWEQDKKKWRYMYGPDTPAEDEWIVEDGKEYYVDSKGYMKTGWITDESDGNKYYLGEDGAKCYNTFTKDDKFVGPEGTVVERFDTWRKAVKKELNAVLKSREYKKLEESMRPGFLLADLNCDSYKDLAIVDNGAAPSRLLYVGIWNPEEEKYLVASQMDWTSEEVSWLTRSPQEENTWLVVDYGNGLDLDYFELKRDGYFFDNLWHFTTDVNDWDDIIYFVNGSECELEDWNAGRAEAAAQAGAAVKEGWVVLTEDSVSQTVDQVPDGTELLLWE